MSLVISYTIIRTNGGECQPIQAVGFFFYRELITILPNLIKSRLKQKLPIEPTEYNASACNELTVLSCDLHII